MIDNQEGRSMPTAIVTGVTGQDGAYLARNLLNRGHRVVGTFRSHDFWRLDELGIRTHPSLVLTPLDLLDLSACVTLLERHEPEHFYNLAAQSSVNTSFSDPFETVRGTGLGPLNCLEAIRRTNPKIRFFQASTSELFGKDAESPQTERTPFHPKSPYAIAKLHAHLLTENYRETFGLFGACGILFNHESPLRGCEFVTRKITRAVAAIALGRREPLVLGNLESMRDWGFADEYVEGMRRMLEDASHPDTFILATGRTTSVRRFVEIAFDVVNIKIDWRGAGVEETGLDAVSGRTLFRVAPEFFRPADAQNMVGNPSKALTELGWRAETDLSALVKMMVEADVKRAITGPKA